jgi:hypothetical protein
MARGSVLGLTGRFGLMPVRFLGRRVRTAVSSVGIKVADSATLDFVITMKKMISVAIHRMIFVPPKKGRVQNPPRQRSNPSYKSDGSLPSGVVAVTASMSIGSVSSGAFDVTPRTVFVKESFSEMGGVVPPPPPLLQPDKNINTANPNMTLFIFFMIRSPYLIG